MRTTARAARPRGAAMYFNVNWENNTFKVNTTGFVIDGTTLIDYKGTSKIIEIPDEVTEIADGACNYVNTDVSLVSVTIPASVTAIGKLAFKTNIHCAARCSCRRRL